jgi:Ricin-type beta-trefoil lectin domain-like
MPDNAPSTRVSVGVPGIITIEVDDALRIFRRKRTSDGPFMIIGRDRDGLSVDTAFGNAGDNPILWPAHGEPHQLWYFRKAESEGTFLIVSVSNGMVLDAGAGSTIPRPLRMQPSTGAERQRWRLHKIEGFSAFIIESVPTGHVLDIPHEAGAETHTPPVLWDWHGAANQQFLIVTPTGGLA